MLRVPGVWWRRGTHSSGEDTGPGRQRRKRETLYESVSCASVSTNTVTRNTKLITTFQKKKKNYQMQRKG